MLNLFQMMQNAQGGQGVDLLARQFNLSQQQAQLAVEALLPAFSQGLKRNAADPYGMGAFMGAMASGQHARFFDDASSAFSPQGVNAGNDILAQIFGSKDLSRAVAAQAAQATGIGQQILTQMLPVIASMLMGGLFKQSTGGLGAGPASSGNPLQDMMGEMMRKMGGGQGGGMMGGARTPRPEAPQPGANPFDNPFGRMLEGMFGGGASRDDRAPQNPTDNPFGKMFEEMLGGRREPEPQQPVNPSGRPRNPYDDVFGKMFETGAKTRDDYERSMGDVFDQFKRGMDRSR